MKLLFYIPKGLKYILHPPAVKNSIVDKQSFICPGCELYNIKLGRYSYLGSNCFLVNTSIGNFSSIADKCCVGGANHPMKFVSTSPVFYEGKNVLKKNFSTFRVEDTPKTIIGNDVWIGMGCYIKAGVTIGDGSVLGMGSVLTKDVPPYEVWAGNPAKKIRNRFDDDVKIKLLKTRWWEWDDNKISKNSHFFNNVDKFVSNNKEDLKQ